MHMIHSLDVDEDALSTTSSTSNHAHHEITIFPESFCIFSHMQLKNQFLCQLPENLHLKQLTTTTMFKCHLVDIIKTINIWLLWYFLHLLQLFSQHLITIPHRGFLYFMQLTCNALSHYLDMNLDLIEHIGDATPILRYITPLNLEEFIEFTFATFLGVYLLINHIIKTAHSGFCWILQHLSRSTLTILCKSNKKINASSLDKLLKVNINDKSNKEIKTPSLDKLSKVNNKIKSNEKINNSSLDKLSKVNNNSKSNRKIKASKRNPTVNDTHSSDKSNVESNAHNNADQRSSLQRLFNRFSNYVSSTYKHWFNEDERCDYHIKLLKKALRKNSKKRKNKHYNVSTCGNLFDHQFQTTMLESTNENYDNCSPSNRKIWKLQLQQLCAFQANLSKKKNFIFDSDSFPVVFDSGASSTSTNNKADFMQGTFVPLEGVTASVIASGLEVSGHGSVS